MGRKRARARCGEPRIALEVLVNEVRGGGRAIQPRSVGRDRVEHKEGVAHEKRVAKVGTCDILFVMGEASPGQGASGDDPVGRSNGIIEVLSFAGDGVETGKRGIAQPFSRE